MILRETQNQNDADDANDAESGTVSYTHLDVYKRQMQYRSACVLTESLRIQLAAGKRPAELDLGRWETLRVQMCIRDRSTYISFQL